MQPVAHSKSSLNWISKYKLYHIPFWCVYNYIWWVIAIGNPIKAADSIFFSPFVIKYLFYVIFQAVSVYFNLYFLIPRYLEKGRFAEYIIYLILTIFFTAVLIVPGYYISAALAGKTPQEVYGPNASGCFYFFISTSLPSAIASMTLGMSIKLAKNWIKTQRRQQLLEKEKLETELKFLKYQFNPHFLFNSINSIFFLIHKNPDMASASLAKFSDLLRYQLYECNDHQISLDKEIIYMENFIELEKLRQNNNVEVSLDINRRHAGHLSIAPFILMTFVENAFKHVSKHATHPNWIKIKLEADQQHVYFTIFNSKSGDTSNKDVINYGGIGLQNVQRRLDLLYPGMHALTIENNSDIFKVTLQLTLIESSTQQPLETQQELAFTG
ncbi:sensor histidine kinase [Chitinophagaceae bacterium LWZ2-11]